jgi:hypothetical protein
MTEAMAETMTADAVFELLTLDCRVDGLGSLRYYNALGQRHRAHGPAIEYTNGRRDWYQNGQLHRLDGPAIEYTTGEKFWYQNDLLHRVDGPAVERADGHRAWYINGKELTQAEWQKAVARWRLYD